MLSVLTYNILFGNQLDNIAEWLKNHNAKFDILCFQEFPKEKINFMLKFLQPENYDFKYGTNFLKNGKDYGELTLVNKKKIKFLDSKIIFLGTNIVEKKVFGLEGERSALITKLKFDNKTFIFSNSHLIAYALNFHRRAQLETITSEINNLTTEKNTPAVVVGDFNYTSLLFQKSIFDFMEKKGFKSGHNLKTHNLFNLKHHQLDYVFHKNCNVRKVEVVKLSFSDHFPVFFELHI